MIYSHFMKISKGIISTLLVGSLYLTASQIGFVNAANSANPITSPITSPITGPVPTTTPTVTPTRIPTPTPKPIAKYNASGSVTRKVTYTYIINRKKHTYTFTIPASDVTIKAINQKTKQIITTKTDLLGKYSLNLEKGQYTISAFDTRKTTYSPAKVNINLTRNIKNINFQGK